MQIIPLLKNAFRKHRCASCSGKLRRIPFSMGDHFVYECLFQLAFVIVFLLLGFFVEALGGGVFVAFCLSLTVTAIFAYAIQFKYSSHRCLSCGKVMRADALK